VKQAVRWVNAQIRKVKELDRRIERRKVNVINVACPDRTVAMQSANAIIPGSEGLRASHIDEWVVVVVKDSKRRVISKVVLGLC
jgi:hypothetical protein